MEAREDRLRLTIIQAWAGMLFVLLGMCIMGVFGTGIKGDLSEFTHHPGVVGVWGLTVIICVNLLVQMAVRLFSARPFRWGMLGFTVLYIGFFIFHQVDHVTGGEEPPLHWDTIFDVTMYVLGAIAALMTYRWATLREAPANAKRSSN